MVPIIEYTDPLEYLSLFPKLTLKLAFLFIIFVTFFDIINFFFLYKFSSKTPSLEIKSTSGYKIDSSCIASQIPIIPELKFSLLCAVIRIVFLFLSIFLISTLNYWMMNS